MVPSGGSTFNTNFGSSHDSGKQPTNPYLRGGVGGQVQLPFLDARNKAAPTPVPTRGSASRMLLSVSLNKNKDKKE